MKILIIGSSIFHAWYNIADAMPEHEVINRAIGGTITEYWKDNLNEILIKVDPDAVLMYCGSNDICVDVPENEIINNIKICRSQIYNHNLKTRFAYFSIIKAPQKEGKWEVIDELSTTIKSFLKENDIFVELNEIFFINNSPVEKLFMEDRLHLTNEAYIKMVEMSKPLLKSWLDKK